METVEKKICSACGGTSILHCGHDLMFFCAACYSAHVQASHGAPAAKLDAETLTPKARAWLERFTPESWEGFPGYEPEVATAIRQALTTIDAANAEIGIWRQQANLLKLDLNAARREGDQWKAEAQKQSAFAGECNRERLEEKRQRVTQGETIHEQEERIEALEAALAKAHGHINSLGDPCNDLVPGEGITVSERDAREALRFQTKRIEVLEAVVANVPHLVVMKDGERPQAFHENPDGSVWRPEHIAKDCARFGGRCAALAGLPGASK